MKLTLTIQRLDFINSKVKLKVIYHLENEDTVGNKVC